MRDGTRVKPLSPDEESTNQAPMHAAIGRFSNSADAAKAVKALKQAGFSDGAISFRDLIADEQENESQRTGLSNCIMVGVEAEGEKAAEAWSILREVSKLIKGGVGMSEIEPVK